MQEEAIEIAPATRFVLRGIRAEELQKNVFRIETEDGVISYYVKSERWQHKGKVCAGTIQDLLVWMKKKGVYDAKSAL